MKIIYERFGKKRIILVFGFCLYLFTSHFKASLRIFAYNFSHPI